MDELAASVRKLQDRQEILDRITAYCRGVDRMDRELILSAYHPDAVDDHGVFVGSPQGFADWVIEVCRTRLQSSSHMIMNHTCEIDGDTAHAETYVLTATMPLKVNGGRYIDRLERRDGRWGIVARKLVLDWWFPNEAAGSGIMPEQINAAGPPARDASDPSYERPLTISAERLAKRGAA
jgi:hypothetical protein